MSTDFLRAYLGSMGLDENLVHTIATALHQTILSVEPSLHKDHLCTMLAANLIALHLYEKDPTRPLDEYVARALTITLESLIRSKST